MAVKTMKKAEIISSKHVDHIENEKKILEKIVHPFVVSLIVLFIFQFLLLFMPDDVSIFHYRSNITDSCKTTDISIL